MLVPQNIMETTTKIGGKIVIMNLSMCLSVHEAILTLTWFEFDEPVPTCCGLLYSLVTNRIPAYSKMAIRMKARHTMIHMMRAVTAPPDLGDSLDTEFIVLTKQRKSVSKIATLPGIACGGIKKLV